MTVTEHALRQDYDKWRNTFRRIGDHPVGGDGAGRFALELIYDLKEQLAAALARLDALESA